VILHVFGSVLVFVAALRFHLALFTRPEVRPDAPDLRSDEPATRGEKAPLAPA
jgi:hypothetical protein